LLHPPMLDMLGLRSSVLWYIEEFHQRTGVRVSAEFPESLPKLDGIRETTLFRIVQESLTNVHKHAKALNVRVSAATNGKDFRLEISDDGVGFSDGLREGVGMRGMRERVHELGGTLRVESGEQAGTSIIAWIPVKCD